MKYICMLFVLLSTTTLWAKSSQIDDFLNFFQKNIIIRFTRSKINQIGYMTAKLMLIEFRISKKI